MVYERTGLLLAERDQPQEDADLFKDFDQARLGRREVYKDLALDPERAKQATDLWQHGGNPNLSATHLDEVVLATRIRALKDYKRELIAAVDLDSATQQAYRWRDIIRRHVVTSYAHGTTNPEDRSHTSEEAYAFMNVIDTMYQARLTPDDPTVIESKARTKTDSLALLVLKGTDGLGGAYLKYKVYLEGNVACWLESVRRGPEAIAEGDLGKFDITNPRHIKLLQDKGLLPRVEEVI